MCTIMFVSPLFNVCRSHLPWLSCMVMVVEGSVIELFPGETVLIVTVNVWSPSRLPSSMIITLLHITPLDVVPDANVSGAPLGTKSCPVTAGVIIYAYIDHTKCARVSSPANGPDINCRVTLSSCSRPPDGTDISIQISTLPSPSVTS